MEGPEASPAVSVIVPVYNGATYLRECLDSVFSQTCQDFEVIVVDDGSTDETASICSEYRLRLIQQQNRGQAVARNQAALGARGEYLAFMDHDDCWYPERLERGLSAMLCEPQYAMVYSDVDLCDETGALTGHTYLASLGDHPKQTLRQCLERDMSIVPSSVTIRKSVFDELRGFDESLRGYEDEYLFLHLFQHAPIKYLPEPLVRWRHHSRSTTKSRRFFESRITYLRKLLDAFPDRPEKNEYLSSRCIAPRFLTVNANDYLTALRGDGVDVNPREFQRGMRLALAHLRRAHWSVRLLAYVPYPLARTVHWLSSRLPVPASIRNVLRPRIRLA